YAAAQEIARSKAALEPFLEQHGIYTPERMRIAKLIPAFHMHFRDQDPFVDTTVGPGESPFRLGGKEVSVNEVAKKLEAKGVHEDQLAFSTTKPFQSETAAYRSGRVPGGRRQAPDHLSGQNFIRGQWDMEPASLERQHLTSVGEINHARGDVE